MRPLSFEIRRETLNSSPDRSQVGAHVGWSWTAAYLLVILAIWSIVGRYPGIVHDAILYSLQAAARLSPEPLAQDLFLRFESQDRFTVFSRFCAVVVGQLGIDRAAATLTFVFLLAWALAAWAVARKLQGSRLALLALPLLLFIPGWYSAHRVFRYAEPFMTARGAAEALCLAALLALLYSKRILAVVLILLATAVHPLITFPVVLLMLLASLGISGWRQWIGVGLLLVGGATVGGFIMGMPEPLIGGEWLSAAENRSRFMFINRWGPADWAIPAQTLLTLAMAAAVLGPGQARQLCRAALCVGAVSIVLTVVSSEIVPLKILLQGQPWRWLWICRFVATAVLPLLLVKLWHQAGVSRAATGLLACAWLVGISGAFGDVPPFGASGLLCLSAALVWAARNELSERARNGVRVLAVLTLALVAATFFAFIRVVAATEFSFGHDPMWVQRVADAFGMPGITVLTATSGWYATIVRRNLLATMLLVAAATALSLAGGAETARRWTKTSFGQEQRVGLEQWRAIIPVDAEVLWPDSPQSTWFLLDRQSYLTISQGAGLIFSKNATAELMRRAQVLTPLVSPGRWFLDPESVDDEVEKLTPHILRQICIDPALGFVVSEDLAEPVAGSAAWPRPADRIYLYDCREFRPGKPS